VASSPSQPEEIAAKAVGWLEGEQMAIFHAHARKSSMWRTTDALMCLASDPSTRPSNGSLVKVVTKAGKTLW
jgi:hypothetical protein